MTVYFYGVMVIWLSVLFVYFSGYFLSKDYTQRYIEKRRQVKRKKEEARISQEYQLDTQQVRVDHHQGIYGDSKERLDPKYVKMALERKFAGESLLNADLEKIRPGLMVHFYRLYLGVRFLSFLVWYMYTDIWGFWVYPTVLLSFTYRL